MEIELKDVRVPATNLLLGEGRGFEIAQGRLGPGRIHHCMRTIGAAEEALKAMVLRLQSRVAFGKRLMEHSIWEQRVARGADRHRHVASALPQGRRPDGQGRQQGRGQAEIAMIKVYAPQMALQIIDDAVQAHGGAGVSPGFRAGGELGRDQDAAAGGRAGRGAQPGDRQAGVRQACGPTTEPSPRT